MDVLIIVHGCHNKEAQDFNYGQEFNKQEILEKIKDNSILKGITISGGEPLCKENIKEVHNFIQDVKAIKPGFNVWCYSGYTFDKDIIGNMFENWPETKQVMSYIDVLVDGKFDMDKKDLNLKFRGSSNQRIIDVQESLKVHKVIPYDI